MKKHVTWVIYVFSQSIRWIEIPTYVLGEEQLILFSYFNTCFSISNSSVVFYSGYIVSLFTVFSLYTSVGVMIFLGKISYRSCILGRESTIP